MYNLNRLNLHNKNILNLKKNLTRIVQTKHSLTFQYVFNNFLIGKRVKCEYRSEYKTNNISTSNNTRRV